MTALPYFALYARDLKLSGYRYWDILGVYALNLLLIPVTALSSPTNAKMATLTEDAEMISGLLRYTCPFDMTGSPTITLPTGFTPAGTPVAFQFVARHFEEDLLVRAGWHYQQATDWHRRHPSL